jgi:hypothetical protein
MRRLLPRLPLLLALAGISGLSIGCGDDAKKPAAQTAEKALGINPQEQKTTTTKTNDVTEVVETKVIENKTGKVVSDTKQITPVEITEKTAVRKDVQVKVGETKTTGK